MADCTQNNGPSDIPPLWRKSPLGAWESQKESAPAAPISQKKSAFHHIWLPKKYVFTLWVRDRIKSAAIKLLNCGILTAI